MHLMLLKCCYFVLCFASLHLSETEGYLRIVNLTKHFWWLPQPILQTFPFVSSRACFVTPKMLLYNQHIDHKLKTSTASCSSFESSHPSSSNLSSRGLHLAEKHSSHSRKQRIGKFSSVATAGLKAVSEESTVKILNDTVIIQKL